MKWNHGHGVLPSVIAKEFNWCYLGWYIGWISNRLDRHISKLTRIFEGHQPPILEWQLGRSASGRHFVCAQPNYGIALQDRWFVSEFRLQSSSSTQCSSWSPVCSISLPTLWCEHLQSFLCTEMWTSISHFFLKKTIWTPLEFAPSIFGCRGAGRWQKRVDIVGCQSAELRWHLRWDIHLATDDWYHHCDWVTRKNV